MPAVVSVSTSKVVRQGFVVPYMFQRPFYREGRQTGLGSGVIVTSDGYILTNNHVVSGADDIKVTLPGGKKEYEAKLVGSDPRTDVAVLKIEATGLPRATLGDSSNLKVGDIVLAIGSPLGLNQTVTSGIVSALGRSNFGVLGRHGFENFIQTDAPINQGNSGGALIDAKGRVIGINTAIALSGGGNTGNIGIGFAIPSKMAIDIVEQLIDGGNITRGYLGVYLQEVNPRIAQALKLDDPSGALVAEVSPGSPAAKGGLKEEDVVISFDGKKIPDVNKLRVLVAGTKPDAEARLTVVRDGKPRMITLKIGAIDDRGAAVPGPMRSRPDDGAAKKGAFLQGVEIAEVDAGVRKELQLPDNARGVVVTSVAADSPAGREGLKTGDIIVSIGRRPVTTVSEAAEARAEARGDILLLRVFSNGSRKFVAVPID